MRSIRGTLVAFALLATLVPAIGLAVMSFVTYRDITQRSADQELRLMARGAAGELALQVRERAQALRTLSAAPLLVEAVAGAGHGVAAADGRPTGTDGRRSGTDGHPTGTDGRRSGTDGRRSGAPPRTGGAQARASGTDARTGGATPGASGIDPHEAAERAATYLRSVHGRLDGFVALALVDGQANAIASTGDGIAPVSSADDASRGRDAGFLATRPRYDVATGRATLALQVPVQDDEGRHVGALAGVVDLAPAVSRLTAAGGGPPAEILVVSGDGVPIAGTARTWSRTPFDPETWVALRADDGIPARYTDDGGRELLGVAARAGSIPLYVVAQRERAAVLRAWMDVARWFALLVAGLALLVGLVAWWMGRAIVTPLAALTAAADRVAAGDLAVAVRDDTRDEVGRLARAFATMVARLRAAQTDMTVMQRDLARKNVVLQRIATTDGITGLANRKAFDAVLGQRFEAFSRDGTPFALVMVALDGLDRVNADFGYTAGDELLVDLAALLRQEMTGAATIARFAGERFVALLPEVPFDAAVDLAERVRTLVDAPRFGGAPRPITVSAGVAQAREGDSTSESILFRVDHALHEARREGGNRVRSAM